jgi:hypothetical protein
LKNFRVPKVKTDSRGYYDYYAIQSQREMENITDFVARRNSRALVMPAAQSQKIAEAVPATDTGMG